MRKFDLRKIYLERQIALSPAERTEKSAQILTRFFAEFDLGKIHFLHCFLPIQRTNEIDTKPIFTKIWRDFSNIETLAPRINFETSEIENLIFTSETELIQNRWLIHEPAHSEKVETEKIDMVLVPLLCFDGSGQRVGYGKGFYDRFLKNCRKDCLKIGLSYFPPIEKISDAWESDVMLDFCVTPEEIFNAKTPRRQDAKLAKKKSLRALRLGVKLFFLLQNIPNLGQQSFSFRRSGRRDFRLHSFEEFQRPARQQKHNQGDDREIDNVVDKLPIHYQRFFRFYRGIYLFGRERRPALQTENLLFEIDAAGKQRDERHNYPVCKGLDNNTESRAYDHRDRQIENISAREKCFKIFPHKMCSLSTCFC